LDDGIFGFFKKILIWKIKKFINFGKNKKTGVGMRKTTVSVTRATKKRIDRIAAEKNLTREEVIVLALNALEERGDDREEGKGRAD
jgi:hypothetical protein